MQKMPAYLGFTFFFHRTEEKNEDGRIRMRSFCVMLPPLFDKPVIASWHSANVYPRKEDTLSQRLFRC
jgi:hypothetical protein